MSGWLRSAAAPLRGGSRTVSCCPSSRVPGADGRRHGSPRSEDADPPMVLITVESFKKLLKAHLFLEAYGL
ncbi:unnamed protein product [Boreogadus saida]